MYVADPLNSFKTFRHRILMHLRFSLPSNRPLHLIELVFGCQSDDVGAATQSSDVLKCCKVGGAASGI